MLTRTLRIPGRHPAGPALSTKLGPLASGSGDLSSLARRRTNRRRVRLAFSRASRRRAHAVAVRPSDCSPGSPAQADASYRRSGLPTCERAPGGKLAMTGAWLRAVEQPLSAIPPESARAFLIAIRSIREEPKHQARREVRRIHVPLSTYFINIS